MMEDDQPRSAKNSLRDSQLTAHNNMQIGDNRTEHYVTHNYHTNNTAIIVAIIIVAALALTLVLWSKTDASKPAAHATAITTDSITVPESAEAAAVVSKKKPSHQAAPASPPAGQAATVPPKAFLEISGSSPQYTQIVESLLTRKLKASGLKLTNNLSSSTLQYKGDFSFDTVKKELVRTVYFTRFHLNITVYDAATSEVKNSISLSSKPITHYDSAELESSLRQWLSNEINTLEI